MITPSPLLSVERLTVANGQTVLVDSVSFEIARGEIVALVGESGSGKSLTARALPGLIDPPARLIGGVVRLGDRTLTDLDEASLRRLRGSRLALIPQDPRGALNLVLRVEEHLIETIRAHRTIERSSAREIAVAALIRAGIDPATPRLRAWPHELSGGLRQRVAIALALVNDPDLIIADEATTALDPTVQARILAEVRALAGPAGGTSFLWITHDLRVVEQIADRAIVLYAGQVVESGPAPALLGAPMHPYTAALLACLPAKHRRGTPLQPIEGAPPRPGAWPAGCRFAPRCERASTTCLTQMPPLQAAADSPDRQVRCHHPVNQ
jgi:peptide/nickel transport system ATP-binding protein